MSDAVDLLERELERELTAAGVSGLLPVIYRAVDTWRHLIGSQKIYVAKTSTDRRNAQIAELTDHGKRPAEIAGAVGISISQTRRIVKTRRSGHIL